MDEDKNQEDIKSFEEAGSSGDLEGLKKRIAELEVEVQENLSGWQRAKADFMNYKKDQERSLAEFRNFANEDIILKLLPTIDSFDLATKHLPEELNNSDWVKGVMCIKGMFESFLKEVGVSSIVSVGEKFDPNVFEAVAEEESDKEEGVIIEEMQKGYRLGEKVLRPAKVKVSKGKNIDS